MAEGLKIWVFSICRNEADIVPFYLRHYSAFAERILVWDDHSDDGTIEKLLLCPKVTLGTWPGKNGIDEDAFLQFAYSVYPLAKGNADWVIWVDMDEFIYHPAIIEVLKDADDNGIEVARPDGFNMTGNGLPQDDGKSQIWELRKTGVRAPVYSKPVVFKPHITIRWIRGKHGIENCNPVMKQGPLKLLHYRYLGFDYTLKRNARNWDRTSVITGDKGAAWSCSPGFMGEHSAPWARSIEGNIEEVI